MFKPARLKNSNVSFVHPDGFQFDGITCKKSLPNFKDAVNVTESLWYPSEKNIVDMVNGSSLRFTCLGADHPVTWFDTTTPPGQEDFRGGRQDYVDTMRAMCALIRKLEPTVSPAQMAIDQIVFAISRYCEVASK